MLRFSAIQSAMLIFGFVLCSTAQGQIDIKFDSQINITQSADLNATPSLDDDESGVSGTNKAAKKKTKTKRKSGRKNLSKY